MTSPAKSTLLTEGQQQLFNAAAVSAAEIAAANAAREAVLNPRPPGDHGTKTQPHIAPKQERKSHTGRNGRPKKMGSGGKGTWGSILDHHGEAVVDKNDPNYDSDEDPYNLVGAPVARSLEEFKEAVTSIVEEYFVSDDITEAATDLKELEGISYQHYFVKRLISIAMDRNDREKEMASCLLSALYADAIDPAQMAKGFSKLVESVEDLELDIPNARDVLSLFLARAVVDDILPPAFLSKTAKSLPEGSASQAVVRKAESHINTRHAAERVERCWGGSLNQHVDEVKDKIRKLLIEYVDSGDKEEASRCVRNLNVPFYHHEVVKQALVLAMDKKNSDLLALLADMASTGLISSSQMSKGFGRVSDAIEDLSLDVPDAKEKLAAFVNQATTEGWLSPRAARKVEGELHMPTDTDSTRKFKDRAADIIREYFSSDDISEVARSLEELNAPEYHHIFVKRAITMAMDRHSREKEAACVLISALYGEVLTMEQIEQALLALLEQVGDLALDIPDASTELSLFVARAVVDDVVPPLFLKQVAETLKDNSLGLEVVHRAQAMISARHAGERVLRCWGHSGRTLDDAKDAIIKLLEEYASGGEMLEACQCIRDLNMPFFHHELVKKGLIMAMEKQSGRVLELLRECSKEGLISSSQLVKGFKRVKDTLDDLSLDIPNAREQLADFAERAKVEGWLKSAFEVGEGSADKGKEPIGKAANGSS